ncbi:diguanylate cyclase [Wenzhouxiangella sp. AB-CW3]|uniref:GGDEF domain-containing protein n=1 Tax=Wenzhouxiangella sp. AB-CW3 TaxID=2771012 RepID=UPI00168B262C|nr:diguanylate cyclase [Wenzhouxiangella sp. AB-CW3]QOC22268.1 diguanylate cyclase [Wenzhouxiangella sp. AB-CW3]
MNRPDNSKQRIHQTIGRHNLFRQHVFTLITLPLLFYLLVNEVGHMQSTPADLLAYFGSGVNPELFEKVVALRLTTIICMVAISIAAVLLRHRREWLGTIGAAYVLATGLLLIATASMHLGIRGTLELFYLKIFVYSAVFLMRPALALTFFPGALIVYFIGGELIIQDPSPSLRQGLYFNATLMTSLALLVNIQNYRGRWRELKALIQLESDNRELEKAKSAIEASSVLDGLTGVFNRMKLETDLQALNDNKRLYALAMIDIDHFKPYNDHYGHAAGDDVLRTVAQTLKQSLNRPDDQVYRYGGEEFLVILPDTTQADAVGVIDRMRRHIERLSIRHEYRDDGIEMVTISAGVADTTGADRAGVMQVADQRLYEGKRAGRNRVVLTL